MKSKYSIINKNVYYIINNRKIYDHNDKERSAIRGLIHGISFYIIIILTFNIELNHEYSMFIIGNAICWFLSTIYHFNDFWKVDTIKLVYLDQIGILIKMFCFIIIPILNKGKSVIILSFILLFTLIVRCIYYNTKPLNDNIIKSLIGLAIFILLLSTYSNKYTYLPIIPSLIIYIYAYHYFIKIRDIKKNINKIYGHHDIFHILDIIGTILYFVSMKYIIK